MFVLLGRLVVWGSFRVQTVGARWYSPLPETFEVIYKNHGDPEKVLTGEWKQLSPPNGNAVTVKMLASPINPADINMIQGVYPIKPRLPAVGGNEGVAEVVDVGKHVKSLRKGDWVVPKQSGWGTWRSYATCMPTELLRVPNDIPVISAATLGVNPCTAYRLLKDFVDLQAGDVIIQNGANSSVGLYVIQIAKILGLVTVNIVRDRPSIDELKESMKQLGADHVVTDEFVRSAEMKSFMNSLPKPRLALNCVGGRAAAELLKYLRKHGTMVTYGGMSKQPLMVPAGPLIFSDVILRGFWMTQWNADHSEEERHQMWETLCDMLRSNSIRTPAYNLVHIEDFQQAISKAMKSYTSQKQILVMDKHLISTK